MHTLIAHIYTIGSTRTDQRVVFANGNIHYAKTLEEAKRLCFAAGATTIASFKDRPEYLRASRYSADSPLWAQDTDQVHTKRFVPTVSLSNN